MRMAVESILLVDRFGECLALWVEQFSEFSTSQRQPTGHLSKLALI
jgi:hypothetical protein